MAPQDALRSTAIENLRALPWHSLRPSALVDFILLLACGKPAVRLQAEGGGDPRVMAELSAWCRDRGFDMATDGEGFACVASEAGYAGRVLEIDRRPEPHELELGLALGYPRCCAERIAALGESGIDDYAREASTWLFAGPYRRINPSAYREGCALISHLPCSPACGPSLVLANRAWEFVLAHRSEPLLSALCHSPILGAVD